MFYAPALIPLEGMRAVAFEDTIWIGEAVSEGSLTLCIPVTSPLGIPHPEFDLILVPNTCSEM